VVIYYFSVNQNTYVREIPEWVYFLGRKFRLITLFTSHNYFLNLVCDSSNIYKEKEDELHHGALERLPVGDIHRVDFTLHAGVERCARDLYIYVYKGDSMMMSHFFFFKSAFFF